MKRSSKTSKKYRITVFSLITIAFVAFITILLVVALGEDRVYTPGSDSSDTQQSDNQSPSNDEPGGSEPGASSDQPNLTANSPSENARFEYQAVQAKDPVRCQEIQGDSVGLGEMDEEITISEEEARARCQAAAERGGYFAPRLEVLIKRHHDAAQ